MFAPRICWRYALGFFAKQNVRVVQGAERTWHSQAFTLPMQRVSCIAIGSPRFMSIQERLYSTKKGSLDSSKKKASKRTANEDTDSDEDSDSDSDDDVPGVKRGESAFWKQKMRTHHHAIDVNKDGTVSWDDFDEMAKRFAKLGYLTAEQQASFVSTLRNFWEQYWGASTDPYAFIMTEEFLRSMQHVVNTPELRKKVASPLPFFFKAVDNDGSGEISVEEFKAFFNCLGLTDQDAVNTFKAIDTNGDGLLSLEEFVSLGKDFFLSEDPTSPSKYFWGPLVP